MSTDANAVNHVTGLAPELALLMADKEAPLHPDLRGWVEDSDTFGPMLRHPLVYQIPLTLPGMANKAYEQKRLALADAVADEDWSSVIWLHERAYRLRALIDYCVGRRDDDTPLPLSGAPEYWDLAADVWVDSENITQCNDEWRALIRNGEDGLWLGSDEERAEFEALPVIPSYKGDLIRAWRGGSVGDWSWTTDKKIAQFFSKRSGLPVRGHLIPKADVFGYLTRRNESELLVKFVKFREALVYPKGEAL